MVTDKKEKCARGKHSSGNGKPVMVLHNFKYSFKNMM
jgi:hypothetical protein